jgi:leucine dehydrogenase
MHPWHSPEFDDHEQVCFFTHPATGLKAIIAIHSTALGPAAGGTRFWPYANNSLALDDALRLSRAMSYKSALANVPFGGGKAVIIGDPTVLKTRALLHAYGEFLNRIGSKFATAEDVGVSVADCEAIREVSPYVVGTASAGAGDPSVHTARGVFHGMRAVLGARLDRSDFTGIHVAVQGLGSVGWHLCEYLHAAGARLTVADIRNDRAEQARRQFAAKVADPETIHSAETDIFAPCALGGVISAQTVGAIHARAVAGAANNQLESRPIGEMLYKRGVLFAPDFVINAGGVIGAVEEITRLPGRKPYSPEPLELRLERIYHRLLDIFGRSAREKTPPEAIALRMGQELISR